MMMIRGQASLSKSRRYPTFQQEFYTIIVEAYARWRVGYVLVPGTIRLVSVRAIFWWVREIARLRETQKARQFHLGSLLCYGDAKILGDWAKENLGESLLDGTWD
jgi:hypothetical protein